jgi:hypothetical protein
MISNPSDLRHRRTGIQSTQGVGKCLGFQQCAEVVGDGGPSVGDGGDLEPFEAGSSERFCRRLRVEFPLVGRAVHLPRGRHPISGSRRRNRYRNTIC